MFYGSIQTTVQLYNVLLLPYDHITKTSGLLQITNENSENYNAVLGVMSSFLYNFFYNGKDTMFDNHDYARHSITSYEMISMVWVS